MDFSPFNPIVKLCLQGMEMEANSQTTEAGEYYLQAWNEAQDDFGKFLAAYYYSGIQKDQNLQLHWLRISVQHAKASPSIAARTALLTLYQKIVQLLEHENENSVTEAYKKEIEALINHPPDPGPFYHGTKAELEIGDYLYPGNRSNYQAQLTMNHIYFTALINGAGLAAALANGEGNEQVYMIEPCGAFENDPNVTDKKFPGNPTRSYRSAAPLKIIGRLDHWERYPQDEIEKFKQKIEQANGKIIN
ncbi:MAG: NAD(+)--rifampin ADP-ribosyltransferase [Flavobacteriales bacterium]|nr:NAD(+)--rifampin ADP-ribosyltransferase [Flavobacteriales bacterium]